MLEVHSLRKCDVVDLRTCSKTVVCGITHQSKNAVCEKKLGITVFGFSHCKSIFVHTKYTYNVAACQDSDVTALHV